MVYVTKADGSKQPFDRNKILRTCLRLRLKYEDAEEITKEIEKRVYEGISTKKILQMIFKYASSYRKSLKYQIDLRESISLLRPKPDFEKFIGIIFDVLGYKTLTNQIVPGFCIEHEVDVIAKKDDETLLVEVKHHVNPHKYTGLDVFLEINSTLEDLKEGYKLGKHSFNFTKALVICNTKISEHAKRYASCKKIDAIAWKYPEDYGLERIIEENKLYPITILKNVELEEAYRLADFGIITLKQLLTDPKKVSSQAKISLKRIQEMQRDAMLVLSG
ncbi:MAG: ATP cone domain-containing protein [Candidatus Aenigmatarchaeota archaeon]